MMRELVVMTQTRQVRVVGNILTEEGIPPPLLNCANSQKQEGRGFAQSLLFNVDSHGVVSGL